MQGPRRLIRDDHAAPGRQMWPLYQGICCRKLGPAIHPVQVGWTHVPHATMPVRGASGCVSWAVARDLAVSPLSSSSSALGWAPGGACLVAGTQLGSAAARAVGETARGSGTALCAAAALRCGAACAALLAHRSPRLSPLVLLSQTCHLVPAGAGTPVGHFLSPLSSEFIPASPALIFLHRLSPLSPPQRSPLGAVAPATA